MQHCAEVSSHPPYLCILLGKLEMGGAVYWNICRAAQYKKQKQCLYSSIELESQYLLWPPLFFSTAWTLKLFFRCLLLFLPFSVNIISHALIMLMSGLWGDQSMADSFPQCVFFVLFFFFLLSSKTVKMEKLSCWQMVLFGGSKSEDTFAFLISSILTRCPAPLTEMQLQSMAPVSYR